MEDNIRLYILSGLLILFLIFVVKAYFNEHKKTKITLGVKFIARVGVFGAISAVLYIFVKFPLPIFPSFLEIHVDEIPILISGFAYGPLTAVFVTLVKTLIKLPMSNTLTVGELCDFVYTLAFVIPASLIYKRHRKISGAIIGLLVGSIFQIIAALLGNIYVFVPFYMSVNVYATPEAILAMCQKVNPAIKDIKWSYGLFAVLPFNALKNAIVIVLTFLVYKSTRRFVDNLQK